MTTTKSKVATRLNNPTPKKHSVKYDGPDTSGKMQGVYIPRDLLQQLTGNDTIPDTVIVTVSLP